MNLPEGFVTMLTQLGLGDAVEAIASREPEVSVRVNARKGCHIDGDGGVPWCAEGVYLRERPTFALDPRWHQGRYYVQEGGSMFVSHVVKHLREGWAGPVAVLDACAAPGGKTTAVMDALPEGSLVVANEYVPARAAVLRENIVKWGYPAAIVTRGDTADIARMGETFDLVIADVPCSGEGMMRKDDEAVDQWSEGLVRECADRQWEIVSNLWRTLRLGGVMIYSTCTFNRQENELTVSRIISELGGESVVVPVDAEWGITPALDADGRPDDAIHAYRFVPGRTRGEGLFLSVIRKVADADASDDYGVRAMRVKPSRDRGKDKGKGAKAQPVPTRQLVEWLDPSRQFTIYAEGDRVSAFPAEWAGVLAEVRRHVDVIHEGIHLGTVKGRDIVPAHGLVMSSAFNKSAFPLVDIDTDTALRYLRGESPALPDGTPRGHVVLNYDGSPLGLVKNLGPRSNSLYPAPWRLKIKI